MLSRTLTIAALVTAAPLSAQMIGSNGGVSQDTLSRLLGSRGGGSGLGGSALGGAGLSSVLGSSVGATGVGNAAGLLSYCVRNRLLGQTGGVASTLGALTGNSRVTQSKGFAQGQAGQLVAGQGPALSLDTLKGKVKTKVCDMVLSHARTMIGR